MPKTHQKKRAIFGGTFNPVHWGHLVMAQTALSQCNLEQVIWVPAYHPPHKSSSGLLEFGHRLQMLQGAIADHAAFTLSDFDPPIKTSYAVSTFLDLQQSYPNTDWYWIVGSDTFLKLPQWYQREQLAVAIEWLVAPRLLPRGSKNLAALQSHTEHLCQQVAQQMTEQSLPLRWQVLSMPILDISSSLIRQYCQEGRSIRYLVPDSVRMYINQEHLYQK